MKKILYVDMDNVLVDFPSGIAKLSPHTVKEFEGRIDEVPGIFALMDPMPDAISWFEALAYSLWYRVISRLAVRGSLPASASRSSR